LEYFRAVERLVEPARSTDSSCADFPARAAPAGPIVALTPEGALELQRRVGNSQAARLLARRATARPAGRVLQRLMSADDLQAFALEYHRMLAKVRALEKPADITKHKKALVGLATRATAGGLDTSHASMYTLLKGLADCAAGARPASDVAGLVARADPKAIGQVGTIAAATFTPRAGGDGSYNDADMKALIDYERQRHPKAKEEPTLRMNIAISAVEQAYRRHQQVVQGVTTPGVNFMVFLGGEWFFGQGRPYSPKEYEEALDRIVAVSALYPDVIFIPGTILTYTKKKDDRYLGVRNRAPVAWHGNLVAVIQKELWGGDLEVGQFIPGSGDPTFKLGDLKLALDICQDHGAKRARGFATDADVQLVTSSGRSPTAEESAVKDLGFMIGADVGGSGGSFMQSDAAAAHPEKGQDVAAETLAYGDPKGKFSQVRLLDYMAPKAIGVQVAPGDRFTPTQAQPMVPKPTVVRKIQIVDDTGALRDITV
jgi:hypothetical protein